MITNGKRTADALELVPPNAPGYPALRMAADWASAVRGTPLRLAYDAATGRVRTAREGQEELTLYTEPNARRPTVLTVEIGIDGWEGGESVSTSLTLAGHEASALFWGEAAVEKFLTPYYASAAASDAACFLERLYDAWYGYPAAVVQVCALVYRFGTVAPEDTSLSLAGSVGLVCLERARRKLVLLSLDEFTAR